MRSLCALVAEKVELRRERRITPGPLPQRLFEQLFKKQVILKISKYVRKGLTCGTGVFRSERSTWVRCIARALLAEKLK
ncbi:hypothetical protein Psfp_01880 [Pelotomaculum sp. FP]|nr:hypothetical protein Psfp_01880 [Pelotomaculum sp. FP]